jgi:formamidopyrimidine-DNA glycosylase
LRQSIRKDIFDVKPDETRLKPGFVLPSAVVPELPDITIYIEALQKRILGHSLQQVRLVSPFLLRTANPPIQAVYGRRAVALRRLGKRVAVGLAEDYWLVLHLMIAGRLHWAGHDFAKPHFDPVEREAKSARSVKKPRMGTVQAHFEFDSGILTMTEAGTKRRASLHVVQGESSLQDFEPGGLEVLECSPSEFKQALTSENHTLKRSLTDPHLFSGIGNAYSDEILHEAHLSPVTLTQKVSSEQIKRLHRATQEVLIRWTERLRSETGDAFPENVTAFRPEMAVHGKFGQPCPVCGSTVQSIRYAENETNYCPGCQTGGKLLADRSLSLLLKRDWPRTPEELEELRSGSRKS